jgi:hypothetical protein
VEKRRPAQEKLLMEALGGAVGNQFSEERQRVEHQLTGVTVDARTARDVSKATLEAAEGVLTGELYLFAHDLVPSCEKDITADVEKLIARMEAEYAKATANELLSTPSSESIGALVAALAIGAKTPTSTPDLIHLDYSSQLNKLLQRVEPIRAKGDMLASIADYLSGRGEMRKGVKGHLRAVATQLRLGASTGYPVREVAEKLDRKALEGLSTLKDFESRMFKRWRKTLTIAATANAVDFYRRTGQASQRYGAEQKLKVLKEEYRSMYSNAAKKRTAR